MDSQRTINSALAEQLTATRSTIEDLDYAEAARRRNRQGASL